MGENVLEKAPDDRLEGIEGWLILPALYLLAVPYLCSRDLIESPLPWLRPEVLGGNVALIVASVVLLVLFFQKRSVVPALMVAFYVMVAAVAGLEYAVLTGFSEGIDPGIVDAHVGDARAAIQHTSATAILWIPYFLVSERVRNTFVVG